MMKTKPYTTEDADRLHGLADQFLEDWAEDAVQGGERDVEYEQRVDEWAAYRPLFLAAPAMLEASEGVVRILVAFSSTTQLGATRKARLEKARAVIDKARGAAV